MNNRYATVPVDDSFARPIRVRYMQNAFSLLVIACDGERPSVQMRCFALLR